MSLPRAARLALVERENPELPLTRQVDLLSLARSSLYYHPAPPSPEEVALKHRTWRALHRPSLLWVAANRRRVAARGGDRQP